MIDDNIRMLLKTLGSQILEDQDAGETLNALIRETVKFRDKLKDETGQVLTVADTKTALEAFDIQLKGEAQPKGLSSEQKALVQIWIDRLTIFK